MLPDAARDPTNSTTPEQNSYLSAATPLHKAMLSLNLAGVDAGFMRFSPRRD